MIPEVGIQIEQLDEGTNVELDDHWYEVALGAEIGGIGCSATAHGG